MRHRVFLWAVSAGLRLCSGSLFIFMVMSYITVKVALC